MSYRDVRSMSTWAWALSLASFSVSRGHEFISRIELSSYRFL